MGYIGLSRLVLLFPDFEIICPNPCLSPNSFFGTLLATTSGSLTGPDQAVAPLNLFPQLS